MGISLGLVGLGSFGSAFADLFMSHPLVDRIALCDREPERIKLDLAYMSLRVGGKYAGFSDAFQMRRVLDDATGADEAERTFQSVGGQMQLLCILLSDRGGDFRSQFRPLL